MVSKSPRWGTPYGVYGEAVALLVSDCFPSSYLQNKANLSLLKAWFFYGRLIEVRKIGKLSMEQQKDGRNRSRELAAQ